MTDKTMVQLPGDSPLMLAWNEYKRGPDYANLKNWATKPEYTDGSLWAAFSAGFNARAAVEASKAEAVEGGPEDACHNAYQAVAVMLSDLGIFDTQRGQNLLDNLSLARLVHDVLPWPSVKPESGGQGEAVAYMHRLEEHGEYPGPSETRLTLDEDHPFGSLGESFGRTYSVITTPLYTHPQPSAAVTEAMVEAGLSAVLDINDSREGCVRKILAAALSQGATPPSAAVTEAAEYEFEIWQDDEMQAGGSTSTLAEAQTEAAHYLMMFGQDSPATAKFFQRTEITAALSQGGKP